MSYESNSNNEFDNQGDPRSKGSADQNSQGGDGSWLLDGDSSNSNATPDAASQGSSWELPDNASAAPHGDSFGSEMDPHAMASTIDESDDHSANTTLAASYCEPESTTTVLSRLLVPGVFVAAISVGGLILWKTFSGGNQGVNSSNTEGLAHTGSTRGKGASLKSPEGDLSARSSTNIPALRGQIQRDGSVKATNHSGHNHASLGSNGFTPSKSGAQSDDAHDNSLDMELSTASDLTSEVNPSNPLEAVGSGVDGNDSETHVIQFGESVVADGSQVSDEAFEENSEENSEETGDLANHSFWTPYGDVQPLPYMSLPIWGPEGPGSEAVNLEAESFDSEATEVAMESDAAMEVEDARIAALDSLDDLDEMPFFWAEESDEEITSDDTDTAIAMENDLESEIGSLGMPVEDVVVAEEHGALVAEGSDWNDETIHSIGAESTQVSGPLDLGFPMLVAIPEDAPVDVAMSDNGSSVETGGREGDWREVAPSDWMLVDSPTESGDERDGADTDGMDQDSIDSNGTVDPTSFDLEYEESLIADLLDEAEAMVLEEQAMMISEGASEEGQAEQGLIAQDTDSTSIDMVTGDGVLTVTDLDAFESATDAEGGSPDAPLEPLPAGPNGEFDSPSLGDNEPGEELPDEDAAGFSDLTLEDAWLPGTGGSMRMEGESESALDLGPGEESDLVDSTPQDSDETPMYSVDPLPMGEGMDNNGQWRIGDAETEGGPIFEVLPLIEFNSSQESDGQEEVFIPWLGEGVQSIEPQWNESDSIVELDTADEDSFELPSETGSMTDFVVDEEANAGDVSDDSFEFDSLEKVASETELSEQTTGMDFESDGYGQMDVPLDESWFPIPSEDTGFENGNLEEDTMDDEFFVPFDETLLLDPEFQMDSGADSAEAIDGETSDFDTVQESVGSDLEGVQMGEWTDSETELEMAQESLETDSDSEFEETLDGTESLALDGQELGELEVDFVEVETSDDEESREGSEVSTNEEDAEGLEVELGDAEAGSPPVDSGSTEAAPVDERTLLEQYSDWNLLDDQGQVEEVSSDLWLVDHRLDRNTPFLLAQTGERNTSGGSAQEVEEKTRAGVLRRRVHDDTHWQGRDVPMHAISNETLLLTPNVGPVRVVALEGETIEGRLHGMGQGYVWLENSLGRMTVPARRVERVEQIDPRQYRSDRKNAMDYTKLPKVRVRVKGGVFIGYELDREGDRITIRTETGHKMTLVSDDIKSANSFRPVGIKRTE